MGMCVDYLSSASEVELDFCCCINGTKVRGGHQLFSLKKMVFEKPDSTKIVRLTQSPQPKFKCLVSLAKPPLGWTSSVSTRLVPGNMGFS